MPCCGSSGGSAYCADEFLPAGIALICTMRNSSLNYQYDQDVLVPSGRRVGVTAIVTLASASGSAPADVVSELEVGRCPDTAREACRGVMIITSHVLMPLSTRRGVRSSTKSEPWRR